MIPLRQTVRTLALFAPLIALAQQQQQQQGQIQIVLDGDRGADKIPELRRTDPRDEPALVRIVEEKGPGTMSALFSLGYLRDPLPATRELLRRSAKAQELMMAYPAVCSLWRIDDAEWRTLANTAMPRLTRTQQMHVATLLFRSGDYTSWPLMRGRILDGLSTPGSAVKGDAFGLIAAAWEMRDTAGEGAALRELKRLAAQRPESQQILTTLADFDPGSAGAYRHVQ